jgi:Fe2+ transport system protein B
MVIESTPFQCSRELSETLLCLFKVLFPMCFATFSTITGELSVYTQGIIGGFTLLLYMC